MNALFSAFTLLIFGVSAQYNYTQNPGNSLAIWAFRPWSSDAWLYGGYFYGYSYASSDDRPTNWTAGDIEMDIYFQMDLTDKKIYLMDETNGGDFYIKKIDPFCTDQIYKEWCTEIIYQCNDTDTICQQQAVSGFNQAVAFDEETRLFWWIGTPDLFTKNYGWYSLNVDTRDLVFHDWGVSTAVRQTANARIYGGYLWVVEKLNDGLVRYNLTATDGDRTIIIGRNDYNLPGATSQNLGAFTFDTSTNLLYFSLHDNYRKTPAVIISRAWDQLTVSPYTQYELGHALPFEIRGMAVNPGKELFYITDDGDTTNTITKLLLIHMEYPPYPRSELLIPSSQYISKSLDVIPGTTLDYSMFYPTDLENTISIDNPQNWNDGEERLIWMEFNGAFYNAAIRQSKQIDFGYYFLDDKINVWERTGVTAQRFSSIYLDLIRERIWVIDPQTGYMRIQYLDFNDNLVHEYYTCAYPQWFTISECSVVFPVCNHDTCSLTVSDNMMYFTSQGNSYFWNLTHYEQVNPRYGPQQFEWGENIYFSGALAVYGNYLYLAASEYGILRKELSTLGIDSVSELFIDKRDFNDELIKCFVVDETRNMIYVCAGSEIYSDSFDMVGPTPAKQITSLTSSKVRISSGSSGIPSSGIIYSLAINTLGTVLWFQFSYGSDIFMLNVPTAFGAQTAGPYRTPLYSLGSSVEPHTFLFYFPSNETTNSSDISICEWHNVACYYKDLIYEENKVYITEWSNIYATGFQMQMYIHLTARYINCKSPQITYYYEKIDFDSNAKYMDIKVDNNNGTLIKKCGEGTQADSCNVWNYCLNDEALPDISSINNGETYILYFQKPAEANGNCYSPERSLNGKLTITCDVEIVEPLPTKAIDCEAENTFCVDVNMEINDGEPAQFAQNLFDDDDDNQSIFYVYFTVSGTNACISPAISFEYEGMWYSGQYKKIDVYTQDNNYHIPTKTCSNPSKQGCTNKANNLCIDMESVNDANDLSNGETFIVQVIKAAQVSNQCSNRNINADITFYCNQQTDNNVITTTISATTPSPNYITGNHAINIVAYNRNVVIFVIIAICFVW